MCGVYAILLIVYAMLEKPLDLLWSIEPKILIAQQLLLKASYIDLEKKSVP
jgi:hypothetical protein